jgi:hypothetical protein
MSEKKEKIKNNKNLNEYTDDELDFLKTRTGKALYNEEPKPKEKKKAHWSDRVKCDICGKVFTRSSRNAHNATVYHRLKKEQLEKIKKLVIGGNELV